MNETYASAAPQESGSTRSLSTHLQENIAALQDFLPIGKSFDLMYRDLYFGDTRAYWLGINGFSRVELLQQIFSDLQNPLYLQNTTIEDLVRFMNAKIGYAQVTLTASWTDILKNVLSGPSVLFIDGFAQAILIDVRNYPARSIEEPDVEKITRGARDGFVETMLFNANLIRRRIRSPHLVFSLQNVGTESQTDVVVAYLEHSVNQELLAKITHTLENLRVTGLTLGSKSLEELLLNKKWWHPLPGILMTERPDVACSYLSEGHILIIVDNSPGVLVLPGTIFQFTQSPEDYYKSPVVGSYFRLVRFFCIPVCLLITPVFLLITAFFPAFSDQLGLLSTGDLTPQRLIFYVISVEFLLDLFKYSAALTSSRFSGALSIVGGLLIGDIAVSLNWASSEVLFYAAVTLLTSLSLASIELADALRLYRIFLILATSLGGAWGFGIGLFLILLSAVTTPTFGGMSYFWPLIPFEWKALRTLLFRYPTAKAQPSRVWKRNMKE